MAFTRRELIKTVALTGGVAAIAACAPAASPAAVATPIPTGQSQKFLSPGNGTPKRGGTLRGRGQLLPHLDPSLATVKLELGQVYSRLFNYRADFYEDTNLQPGLIEKWDVSSDGKTYKFQVRKGVTWHNIPPVNGREFTADDVGWNIDYNLKNGIRGSSFAAVDKWQIVDKYNITITLKERTAAFLDLIGYQHIVMLPREVFEQDKSFRNKAIGTGPWIWESMESGVVTKMKRNPNYWENGSDGKPLPYIDNLEFYTFGDDAAAIAAYRSGKIDIMSMSAADSNDLKKSMPQLLFEDGFRANAIWLQMNHKIKPWDDVRVRQAASFALDRKEFIAGQLDGDSQPSGLIPSSLVDYAWQPDEVLKRYPQDIAQAKKLLTDAGQTGLKVELSSYTGAGDSAGLQIVQRSLNNVGFNATIKQVPTLAVGQENVRNMNYTLVNFTGSSSFEVDDWTYLFWNTKGGRNLQGYSSPEMDRLTEAQRHAGSVDERKTLVNQIQDLMLKDMVAAPLSHIARIHYVVYPVVKNLKTIHWVETWSHLKEAWLDR